MAAPDHCSLRWNNHQSHLLRSFDALLQTKTLVDVTLVCAETSFRAHKVVLSACSPFFERLFAETPCKHPVIALTDIRGWVLQAIVDFMYRGEISVPREHLRQLIQAGESLQVRGLTDHSIVAPLVRVADSSPDRSSPDLSPMPRRKQARPRRRSGEEPQDLSNGVANVTKCELDVTSSDDDEKMASPSPSLSPYKPSNDNNNNNNKDEEKENQPSDLAAAAASACSAASAAATAALEKRERDELQERFILSLKDIRHLNRSFRPTPPPPPSSLSLFTHHQQLLQQQHNIIQQQQQSRSSEHLKVENDRSDNESPFMELMDLSQPTFGQKGSSLNFTQPYQQQAPPHPPSPLHFPSMSSALTLTPPHMFGLDSPLGLFGPGMDPAKMYNPLMEMPDPRNLLQDHHHQHHQPFLKKKLSRPKGQHSAPRGGPPRSWTNAELTEALQHVWNKKMTTSQASRIFGIPYNSLLMYVRGKYGKSLKLEQLRKDCISGPPIELLQMGNPSSRKSEKSLDCAPPEGSGRSASSEPELLASPHMFHPFPAAAFYPDFGALQLSMMNFQQAPPPKGARHHSHDDDKSQQSKQSCDDDYQPLPPSIENH